jgi:hypothetical protein
MITTVSKKTVSDISKATRLNSRFARLMDNGFDLQRKLTPDALPAGNLYWIQKNDCSLFVFIKEPDQQTDKKANNDHNDADYSLSISELKQLLDFQNKLLPPQLHAHIHLLVPLLVIASDINGKRKYQIKGRGLQFLPRQQILNNLEKLPRLVDYHLRQKTSSLVQRHIRSVFSPEVVITHNPKSLLDEKQEKMLKLGISTIAQGHHSMRNYHAYLVRGIAGSGKSLVLLQRMKLLRNLFPEKKILLLSVNKFSSQVLQQSFSQQQGGQTQRNDKNTKILPIMQWCRQQTKGLMTFIYDDEALDIVNSVVQRNYKDTDITADMAMRDINFIKERMIFSEADYQQANHSRVDIHYDEETLRLLWRVTQDFNFELRLRKAHMWSDLPRLLWLQIQEGQTELATYDHILIDGAHNFAPFWFELIKKALRPGTGQLFMTTDPAPAFRDRQDAWIVAGLDVQEHDLELTHSYRITRPILTAAEEFLVESVAVNTDEFIQSDHQNLPDGLMPVLIHVQSEKYRTRCLVDTIKSLLKEKSVKPGDILILDAGRLTTRFMAQDLRKQLKQAVSVLADSRNNNSMRISELAKSTETESNIVIIIGVENLIQAEKKGLPSCVRIERKAAFDENVRQLYMAMTRARKQLFLIYTGDEVPQPLKIKSLALVDWMKSGQHLAALATNVHYIDTAQHLKKVVKDASL